MKLCEVLEGLEDSWTSGNETVTLQDVLAMSSDVPVKKYNTRKLAPIVLNWDDNPDEIKKIEQSNLDYPILIVTDEKGNIQWILDGNHRAQKALKNNLPTIDAKLIKPSYLSNKARRIFGI
jgi:hypothetical protein